MLALSNWFSRWEWTILKGAFTATTNRFSETTTNFTFNSAHNMCNCEILNATRLLRARAIVWNRCLILD